MLFQVGGEGTRPTFFEMAAAQQLPASLRAALTYSLGVKMPFLYFFLGFKFPTYRSDSFVFRDFQVFALRRSFLHKILDYEDEFFASLMLILEGHSLRTTGTFWRMFLAFVWIGVVCE